VKFRMTCPRPTEYSTRIQPMIPVPGHYAWPAGHATQAFMMAELLTSLVVRSANPGDAMWWELREQLWRQADRIATNRVVAGLHFPVDNDAGARLGVTLAHILVDLATGRRSEQRREVRVGVGAAQAHDDFSAVQITREVSRYPHAGRLASTGHRGAGAATPLEWLWTMASCEWHSL
jgi:hypothetical protein